MKKLLLLGASAFFAGALATTEAAATFSISFGEPPVEMSAEDSGRVLAKQGRGRGGDDGGRGRGRGGRDNSLGDDRGHDRDSDKDRGRDLGRDRDNGDASGSGRSKPRIPGGSGCDDPGDVLEHPECRG